MHQKCLEEAKKNYLRLDWKKNSQSLREEVLCPSNLGDAGVALIKQCVETCDEGFFKAHLMDNLSCML